MAPYIAAPDVQATAEKEHHNLYLEVSYVVFLHCQ